MAAILDPESYYHDLIIANPRFYKKTYWGGHRGSPDHTILSARASFMTDMRSTRDSLIIEHEYLHSYERQFGLRHIEYYTGKDNKKYQVCSQNPNALKLTSQQMENEGWKKILPMYSLTEDTYVRVYDREREKIRKKIRTLLPRLATYRRLYHSAATQVPVNEWTPSYWGYDIRRKLTRMESELNELERSLGYAYSEIALAHLVDGSVRRDALLRVDDTN
jgi:hypothetical protein